MSLLTACAAVMAGTVMALTVAGGEPAQEVSGAGTVIEEYLAENRITEKQLALGYDIREVTDDVFEGPQARQFEQAGNRMHTIKAVIYATQGA